MRATRSLQALLIVVAYCTMMSCQPPAVLSPPSRPTTVATISELESQIEVVARELLACSMDKRDCFVDVTEQRTGKMLQIVGASDQSLIVHLPTAQMSDEERSRLTSIMAEFDTADRDTKGFTVDCGRDADAATHAVMRLIREAFQFANDAEFEIVQN